MKMLIQNVTNFRCDLVIKASTQHPYINSPVSKCLCKQGTTNINIIIKQQKMSSTYSNRSFWLISFSTELIYFLRHVSIFTASTNLVMLIYELWYKIYTTQNQHIALIVAFFPKTHWKTYLLFYNAGLKITIQTTQSCIIIIIIIVFYIQQWYHNVTCSVEDTARVVTDKT